jgi:hypothetical protein
MLDHPRVHLMLAYQPAEITALLATRARKSQFVGVVPVGDMPGDAARLPCRRVGAMASEFSSRSRNSNVDDMRAWLADQLARF